VDFPVSPDAIAPSAGTAKKGKRAAGESPAIYGISLQALIQASILKPPVSLASTYKGKELTAKVLADGSVECQGKRHDSLSLAASEARASVVGYDEKGRAPPTNGWTFWKYASPGGRARPIAQARQDLLSRAKRTASPQVTRNVG